MMQKALLRWQDVWVHAVNNTRRDVLDTSGLERYSDGQCWAARKMLEALMSGRELHPYLDRVGHDTLAEFHGFLLEPQSMPDPPKAC